MADIAAANVTYTIVQKGTTGNDQRKQNLVDVAFGNGALTYPAGGIPLTKGKLGLPNNLDYLVIVEGDAGNGLVYKYDASAEKIRIYEGDYAQAGDAALAELDSGSDAPAAATVRVLATGY